MQIGNLVGEGRQRNGVRAHIHFALAITDGERRTRAGRHDRVGLVSEDKRQRIRALQPLQNGLNGSALRLSGGDFTGHELRDDFRIRLRCEDRTAGDQLSLSSAKFSMMPL